MERGNSSTEDLTARVLDLKAAPIGRGQRRSVCAAEGIKTYAAAEHRAGIAYFHTQTAC